MKRIFFFLVTFGLCHTLFAQSRTIRISGIVVAADSLEPVAFTTVSIKNTMRGTISDNSGYFSLLAHELDTLVFSNVGFRPSTYVVPPDLPNDSYGLVQVMQADTLMLEELVVYPWPTAEAFVEAFLSFNPKKKNQTRVEKAQKNIQQALDEQLAKEKFYYDQMRYSRLYNLTGNAPPNNFLNPITWANFIEDWKNGAFKNEDSSIPDMRY